MQGSRYRQVLIRCLCHLVHIWFDLCISLATQYFGTGRIACSVSEGALGSRVRFLKNPCLLSTLLEFLWSLGSLALVFLLRSHRNHHLRHSLVLVLHFVDFLLCFDSLFPWSLQPVPLQSHRSLQSHLLLLRLQVLELFPIFEFLIGSLPLSWISHHHQSLRRSLHLYPDSFLTFGLAPQSDRTGHQLVLYRLLLPTLLVYLPLQPLHPALAPRMPQNHQNRHRHFRLFHLDFIGVLALRKRRNPQIQPLVFLLASNFDPHFLLWPQEDFLG